MRLLLVTPRNSYRTGAYLAAAADLGCTVTVVTDAAIALPTGGIAISFDDPVSAATGVLDRLDGSYDGVVATDGAAIVVAAEMAARAGWRSNPVEAARAAGDKLLQRRALRSAGVPQPRFALAGEDRWAEFPAVVKPVDRAGGQGVIAVADTEGLGVAVDRVRCLVGPAPVIVESLVSGLEVAVEGLVVDGRLEVFAIFDKPDPSVGPTFPETLLVQPARLDARAHARVVGVVERAVTAIGLVHGPVHAECMVDDDDVWFLELAARTIGGLCSRSLRPGGASLEEIVIGQALGRTPDPGHSCDPSGVLMIPVPAGGRLDEVVGAVRARSVPGVTEVILSVGPGEQVHPLPEGDRYLGFVFATGESPDAVEATLRSAWTCLDVRVSASSSDRTGRYQPSGR